MFYMPREFEMQLYAILQNPRHARKTPQEVVDYAKEVTLLAKEAGKQIDEQWKKEQEERDRLNQLETDSKAIKRFRAKSGLSQAEFADKVGVKVSELRAWEAAKKLPTSKHYNRAQNVGFELERMSGKAQKIKGYRTDIGLTQAQFAKHLGVKVAELRAWEIGEKNPTYEEMSRIQTVAAELASNKRKRKKAARA